MLCGLKKGAMISRKSWLEEDRELHMAGNGLQKDHVTLHAFGMVVM